MWPSNITLSVINAENAKTQRRGENNDEIVNLPIPVASRQACSQLHQSKKKKLCVSASPRPLRFQHPARQNGFTLLELVAVIIIIAILGLVALDRFWSLRVAAERATIKQVTGNIRSALGMEVARFALENRLAELPRLDGSNPMLLLAQTPSGYLGEISPDPATLVEGSWHFDPASKTLDYRVIYAENFDSGRDNPARIRFRITLIYRDRNDNQRFDPGLDAISGLDLVSLTH